jgi:hypothetical protein
MEDHREEDLEDESVSENSRYFRPRIFEGNGQADIPPGFDAVTISLDGRIQSDLNWTKAREQAQCAIEKGYAVMWNMQLGLFEGLAQPLANQTQFLTLTLSLEHFRDSLWKEFKSQTLGISLFRGVADFSQHFSWDNQQEQNIKEWLQEICSPSLASLTLSQLQQHTEGQRLIRLFCRDVAIEYLALLATRLPDSLPIYLYLDATSLEGSLLEEIQLFNPERFDRLRLVLKGHQLPFEVCGWESPTAHGYSGYSSVELPVAEPAGIGICIPPMSFYHWHHDQEFEEGLHVLQKHSIPFKLIAESHLTSQWDGLDYLLYQPLGLSVQGKRKLQGFCAAGGTVVSTGNLLGFPYEISLIDWLRTF